jgi:pilus assembly protein CpaE
MLDNTILIKIESKTASLRKSLDEIIRTTDGLEVQRPSDNRRSDLLIFELGEDAENELQAIQSLLDLGTVDEVFLTSKETDPQVLLKAMRAGAKEFFSQPLKMAEVRNALDRYRKKKESATRKEPVKVGQIIDVIGSKGGVGTTTIAVNLAVSLADAIPLFLAFKPNYHWGEITKNFARLDATFLTNILSKHASGVHVLPSPSSLNGQFGATPEIIEHLLEMSNNVLLVSLLSLPCLSNAAKLLYSFSSLGHLPKEDIRIVINRYVKDSEISLKDAEDSIRKEIFWTVPNDYATTMTAINRGKALSQFASKAPITENLKVLADALQESKEQFKSNQQDG